MSLTPAKHRLTLWKGATFAKQIEYMSIDPDLPEDLTNYAAELTIRDRNGTALLTLDIDNGGVSLGGQQGTISLFVTDEETAAITWRNGAYSLRLTDPGGNTDILLYGPVRVRNV